MPNILGPNGSAGDGFETGDLRYWPANFQSSVSTGGTSSAAVNGAAAHTGSFGLDLKATTPASASTFAQVCVPFLAPALPASGVLSWQGYVQGIAIATESSIGFPLVYAYVAAFGTVGLFYDGTNFYAAIGALTDSNVTRVGPNMTFSLTTWHKVEITVTVGASQEAWKLTVDDVAWGGETTTATTGVGQFGFNVGPTSAGSATTCEMYVDNVFLADGYIG